MQIVWCHFYFVDDKIWLLFQKTETKFRNESEKNVYIRKHVLRNSPEQVNILWYQIKRSDKVLPFWMLDSYLHLDHWDTEYIPC